MAKKKTKKGGFSIVKGVFSLALAAGLLVGNLACIEYESLITSYLCGFGTTENSQEAVEAREEGYALAAKVEEEGAVLLKNDNNALPLKNTKVNVFGFTGSDGGFMLQGTGSGSGARKDIVTFLGGLREAGIEYNENLAAAYSSLGWNRVNGGSYVIEAHGARYRDFYGISEAPESFYTDSLINNAVAYSDTAIVVLGRLMGEGNDTSKVQYFSNQAGGGQDNTRKMQSLSAREEYMINLAAEKFENVILVVSATNNLELGIADTDKVDAVVNMGMPGNRGTIGLAKLLKGDVNPSGKLTSTWAYDISTEAAYATSGYEGVGYYTDISAFNGYTEYRENIYTGYSWYETADKEGFWDSDYAKNRWNIKNGYEDVVQYPFGYGLSYTNFDWELLDMNFKNGATIGKDDTVTAKVRVYNTGSVAGKDVVQMYYSAPYTKGGIEKSAIKLGGFAKTPLIPAGQFSDVEIEMTVETMKSYDCYDKNNNGFMGYELEKGNYEISFRTDVHTLKAGMENNTVSLEVKEDIRYEVDNVTGTKVENLFTTYTNPVTGASSKINEPFNPNAVSMDGSENPGGPIEYMTREDFIDTFPEEKGPDRALGELKAKIHDIYTPTDPENLVIPEFGSKKTSYTIGSLLGVPYDDPMWDDLISQLTYNDAAMLITDAGYGTIAAPAIGMPARVELDGPCGFNTNVTGANRLTATNYPAITVMGQTWDWYLIYQVGLAMGKEGKTSGIAGLYGPGGNVHRSAMGGRNFEYFGEDPLLSGTLVGYQTRGLREMGIVAYVKHLGSNGNDHARQGCYKWLTEQAFRENDMKGFEIGIKISGATAIMCTMTRQGGMRGPGCYAMLTGLVRNEWGFRGTIITDYYHVTSAEPIQTVVNDADECIRAGANQILLPNGSARLLETLNTDNTKYYVHQAAKDFVYAYVQTKYFEATAQGLDHEAIIGTMTQTDVFAWWIPLLVLINSVTVTALYAWNSGGSSKSKKKK